MTDVKESAAPEDRAKAEPQRERPTGSATAAAAIVTLILAAIVGLSIWYLARPQPLIVQGEADATRIDIAARVDGRVGQRPVERGQNVTAGQLLFEIDNPELVTKWRQAQAGVDVAKAQLANILVGTRAEIDCSEARRQLRAPTPISPSPTSTYDRIKDLAGSGNAPLQRLDEVTNSREVAKRDQDRAKLAYDEAVNGATKEEREIAQTNVLKAQASVDTIKAQVDELTVKAPIACAGLSDRGGGRGICLARRAASVADRPRRRLAAVQPARGPRARGSRSATGSRCARPRSATRRSRRRSSSSRRAANMPAGARRGRPATST